MEVSARKPGAVPHSKPPPASAAAAASGGDSKVSMEGEQEGGEEKDKQEEAINKNNNLQQQQLHHDDVKTSGQNIARKVEKLIKQAKVASFKEICMRVGVSRREEIGIVLEKLQMDAMNVQGNWVVRSGNENYSKEQRRHALARNYLICLFQRNRFIHKKQVVKILKLDYESTLRILKDLATCVGKGKWEFRKQTDVEFIKHYPEVVKEHAKKIAELEKNMLKILAG